MDLPIHPLAAECGMAALERERGKPCAVARRCTTRRFRPKISRSSRRRCGEAMLRTLGSGAPSWPNCWLRSLRSGTPKRQGALEFTGSLSTSGGNGGPSRISGSRMHPGQVGRGFFPPRLWAIIKRIACELPARHDQPLSRWFVPDIKRVVEAEGYVASISSSTIWRVLDQDAIKPWRRRSWIWSRDPHFFERAALVLDLYERIWQGRPLRADEFVISADEKTSIQARCRLHPTETHCDGRGQRVEHEYERKGAWTYIAGWDVHRARIMGRLESANGIAPFDRFVHQVMRQEPYASARRVFWLVDQGSSHRPTTFPDRLRALYRNAVAIPLPVHASWLNQIEIYFSILERKALTPNDFPDLSAVSERIHAFERIFNRTADPFGWTFTREDLRQLLDRMPNVVLTKTAQLEHRLPIKAAS